MSRTNQTHSSKFLEHPSFKLLQRSIREDIAPLVIVVGSGLSVESGYPDWRGLREVVEILLKEKKIAEMDADPKYDESDIDGALNSPDYWDFFKRSKECLTRPVYTQYITTELSGKEKKKNSSFEKLLELKPKGIVTLNLDPQAGDIFSNKHSGEFLIPIYGFDIENKWHLINDEKQFLIYMHGHISDPNTWVLGKDELDALLAKPAHRLFLTNLYANNTVLFVGVSADDVALSEPLFSLQNAGISANRVFWFTSRTNESTRNWAARASVQIIPYSASNSTDHAVAISTLVNEINKFKPFDAKKVPPSVVDTRTFSVGGNIIEPDDLANERPEFVRKYLSDLLVNELKILPEMDKYERFIQIANEYDYPIQTRSFYRGSSNSNNMFFGYKLTFPPLGMGNFGTVYHGFDEEGKDVAVKIMHSNIVTTPEMLGGFRRGTRSMKILTANHVDGIVPVVESFEMPPTVIMEYVPGNSLEELFDQMPKIPWARKVAIISDAARIVERCHLIKDNVLHRDLKPSNIMVEDLDYDTFEYGKITILDFDMSWHKGSQEKDVVFESRDDFGYLAPEQTDPSIIDQSKTTKVDCFGLGMTALSLFRGKHPIPNMPFSQDYIKIVNSACKTGYKLHWQCLTYRLARLIIDATKPNQDERLTFSAFRIRASKIVDASTHQVGDTLLDLFAEEILARFAEGREYLWNDVLDKGQYRVVGGVSMNVSVDEKELGVRIDINYQDQGSKQFQRRNELIGLSREALEKACRDNDFKIKKINVNHGIIESSVFISLRPKISNVDLIVRALSPSLKLLYQIN